MWDFTEKDIEDWLVLKKDGTLSPTMEVNQIKYKLLIVQHKLHVPLESHRNPQEPLFKALKGLKQFLPVVDDEETFIPDIIARRKAESQPERIGVESPDSGSQPGGDSESKASQEMPGTELPRARKSVKRSDELVVFELKNRAAKVIDIAQLRGYMNLLKYFLDHDIGAIRKAFGVRRNARITGVLLAQSIPEHVWLATSIPEARTRPDMELIAFEIHSNPKKRKIDEINYVNFSDVHAAEFRKRATKYQHSRARAKQPKKNLPIAAQGTTSPTSQVVEKNGASVGSTAPPPQVQAPSFDDTAVHLDINSHALKTDLFGRSCS